MGLVQKNITVAKHRARNGGGREYCERGGQGRKPSPGLWMESAVELWWGYG